MLHRLVLASQATMTLAITMGLALLSACSAIEPVAPDHGDSGSTATTPVYRYGAKFEPPLGRVVHGMGQWEDYNTRYLSLLPAGLHPASQLVFIEIGDTPRGWRPQLIAQQLQSLDQAGLIPVLDIGLRGNQPTPAELDTMQDKLFGIDDDVAGGSVYDGRINDLVNVIRDFHRPVLARIGGEFNGSWNGYHPFAFPQAFRKIVGVFRQAGVSNIAFVWCYEPAAPGDFADTNSAGEHRWFPGNDVVDWFSIDLFAKADVSGPTTVAGRNDLTQFGRTLAFLDMAVASARPVMIAESSPSKYDFGSPAAAQAAWDEWFTPYFQLIEQRPEIEWFHYINYDWTVASYYASSGWQNNDLTASTMLAGRYTTELGKAKYLHGGETSLLKDYEKYK